MKTEILQAPEAACHAPRFPAIYRSRTAGTMWLHCVPGVAVCLAGGSGYPIASALTGPAADSWPVERWERVTSPFDIRFIP